MSELKLCWMAREKREGLLHSASIRVMLDGQEEVEVMLDAQKKVWRQSTLYFCQPQSLPHFSHFVSMCVMLYVQLILLSRFQ